MTSEVQNCRYPSALLFTKKSVVHIKVAIAPCSVAFWLQTSGMVEDSTQRDSDDEWMGRLTVHSSLASPRPAPCLCGAS